MLPTRKEIRIRTVKHTGYGATPIPWFPGRCADAVYHVFLQSSSREMRFLHPRILICSFRARPDSYPAIWVSAALTCRGYSPSFCIRRCAWRRPVRSSLGFNFALDSLLPGRSNSLRGDFQPLGNVRCFAVVCAEYLFPATPATRREVHSIPLLSGSVGSTSSNFP